MKGLKQKLKKTVLRKKQDFLHFLYPKGYKITPISNADIIWCTSTEQHVLRFPWGL